MVAMNRQTFGPLPSLYRSDAAPQIRRNLFPGFQPAAGFANNFVVMWWYCFIHCVVRLMSIFRLASLGL
jgi:hypothetical protein